jgi:AcrR family transcriptional regulator
VARIAGFELTRGNVVEAALRLMESHDPSALSTRSLAQELGVTPGALYHHFANKDEVLTAAVDALYAQVELAKAGPWNDRLHALLASVSNAFQRYPGAVPYLLAHAVITPNGRRVIGVGLACLRDAGFADDQIADAAVMCAVVLTGQAQVETFRRTRTARVVEELANNPDALAEAADMLMAAPLVTGLQNSFDATLTIDLVVHELERRHAAKPRRTRPPQKRPR